MYLIFCLFSFISSPVKVINVVNVVNVVNLKNAVSVRRKLNIVMNDTLIHSLEPPSGGSLKLLTYLNAGSWSYNWLMYISSDNTPNFDEHYYMDYFNMRGVSSMLTNTDFFYLGYFPDGLSNYGPKYIGLFELQQNARIFNTKIIIENPHYIESESKLTDFKEEIIQLTEVAEVFFKYSELDRPEQLRYFLEWNYK